MALTFGQARSGLQETKEWGGGWCRELCSQSNQSLGAFKLFCRDVAETGHSWTSVCCFSACSWYFQPYLEQFWVSITSYIQILLPNVNGREFEEDFHSIFSMMCLFSALKRWRQGQRYVRLQQESRKLVPNLGNLKAISWRTEFPSIFRCLVLLRDLNDKMKGKSATHVLQSLIPAWQKWHSYEWISSPVELV